MALSRTERYAARALRFLSRAFLALLGLVARASRPPFSSSSPAAGSPPASSLCARKIRSVPPPTHELLFLSGVELARRIRRKEVRGAGWEGGGGRGVGVGRKRTS